MGAMVCVVELIFWLLVLLGAIWTHRLVGFRHQSFVFLLGLDICFAVLAVVGFADKSLFRQWMREDGWVEWATFFAFLLAALLGLWRVQRRWNDAPWLERLSVIGVGAFCVFVAGEEISWGQRLFAFMPPDIFLEQNFQQELNLHNFLKDKKLGHLKLDSRYLVALIALFYGLLIPLCFRFKNRVTEALACLRPAFPSLQLAPWFVAIFWVEWTYPIHLGGEAAELGLGMLFLAQSVWTDERFRQSYTKPALVLAVPVATGVLVTALLNVVMFSKSGERVEQTRQELQVMAEDLADPQRIVFDRRKKRRVHKRLFTAVRDGYLRFRSGNVFLEGQLSPAQSEDGRRDRRGYFLDPWNNPYWFVFDRRAGKFMIYSFGANRQRDSNLKPLKDVTPDDIGILVDAK